VTRWRFVFRSLCHYWRTHAFIVLGIAVATAVITGSLLVGDSMAASLRESVLQRLGSIQHVLLTPHYFPSSLASRLTDQPALKGKNKSAAAILTQGAARCADRELAISKVSVLGVDDHYWQLFPGAMPPPQAPAAAAINQALADDLHLKPGMDILVSVDRSGMVSNDVLFAKRRRDETLTVLRLQISAIIPDAHGGNFGLQAGSTPPRNLFIPREELAESLNQPGMANVVLLGKSKSPAWQCGAWGDADIASIQSALASCATLPDYGLKLVQSNAGHYLSLESSALLFNNAQFAATQQAAAETHATATTASVYLATRIQHGNTSEIAYAVIATLPESLRPEFTLQCASPPFPPGVILNSWAAEDLKAKRGDELTLTYLIPTPAGEYRDATIRLTIAGIIALSGPAADQHLTPDLNGLTDAKRIEEWKLPFPVDHNRITARDEEYWDKYGPTPKLFVAPETMQKIWSRASSEGSDTALRGGEAAPSDWITSIHITPPKNISLANFEKQLIPALLNHLTPEKNQMLFRPIREQLLASATGSTDFASLFLAMSFFLVFAAVALAGTLMRLLVEQRASEVGLMLASGWRRRAITSLLLHEGALLAIIGTILGLPAGILYHIAILKTLNHWWMQPWAGGAGTQILTVHITPQSLAFGALSGLLLGILCMIWGVRSLSRISLLRLISGRQSLTLIPTTNQAQGLGGGQSLGSLAEHVFKSSTTAFLFALLALAFLLASAAHIIPPEIGFFCSGTAILLAMLLAASSLLSTAIRRKREVASLLALAIRNAAASRRRSLLTIGLLACASFILVAVAANRRDYSHLDTSDKHSGSGGFTLTATSAVPLHYDLATPQGRKLLGFSPQEEKAFTNVTVFALPECPGDDTSCLNLAKPTHPRLLGITHEFAQWQGFSVNTPWQKLFTDPDTHQPDIIPAFADADSLQWILKLPLGGTYQFDAPDGSPIKLKIIATLPGSIFASELLISDANLKKIYPKLNGATRFLFALPKNTSEQALADALRTALADQGIEVRTTREILNSYISVQNVYLSIFLSLGGLGLLLGTAGMIAVIARSVLERRGELALMAAAGFKRATLIHLITLEHLALLAAGLFSGTAAALLAVAPVLTSGHADVQWHQLAATLATVAVSGIIVCIISAKTAIARNPMQALHEE